MFAPIASCKHTTQNGSELKRDTQNTDIREGLWPGPGTQGPGPGTIGTNEIHIYEGNCLGKAHANVLIIVVPFGSNFTG